MHILALPPPLDDDEANDRSLNVFLKKAAAAYR